MKTTTNMLDDARKVQQRITGRFLKRSTLLALGAALTMTTGCAALGTRCGDPQARIYPGVRRDVQLITNSKSVNTARVPGVETLDGISMLFGMGDLGLSAVVDTLWLPFELVPSHAKPSPQPEQTPPTAASSVSTNSLAKTE